MARRKTFVALLALLVAVPLGACGDDDDDTGSEAIEEAADEEPEETTETSVPAADQSTGGSVAITEPADGATVTSPVVVKMSATDFLIEPAGDGTVKDGSGHFHVMIDTDCVAAGEVIPADAAHVHFGKAQLETAPLELSPGEHTLCLQAGDAAHTALPLTDEIAIAVS